MISLIVARARNGAIGRDGTMPWHLPEDLAFFQRETTGGALVMGRRTWESLPVRPLKNRLNFVVSSDPSAAERVFPDVSTALELAYSEGYHRIYAMGGNRIYSDTLHLADRLLITEVDKVVEDADTFFPDFDESRWTCLRETALRSDSPGCLLRELVRR